MSKQIETKDTLSTEGKSKRDSLRKMALGAAFAVPVVASFSMDKVVINEANAYTATE